MKARLLATIGDDDAALAVLEPALDPKRPNERVVDLLAELKMKAGRLDEAEKLYELARKDDPYHTKWIAGLARVHLRQKNTDDFLERPGHDRRQRCRRHRRSQGAGRAQPGRETTSRKPRNGPASACTSTSTTPSAHRASGRCPGGRQEFAPAVEEYQTALELKPKKPNDVKVKLAKAQVGLGQRDAARATLDDDTQSRPGPPRGQGR